MKVLFISHEPELFGAPKSLLYLVEDLKCRYGVEPVVLVPYEGGLTEELEKRQIPYVVSKYYKWMEFIKDHKSIKIPIKKIVNQPLFDKACNKIKDYNIDMVYSNTSVINIGHYISKKLNVPHVWHIREHGKEDHKMDYVFNEEHVKKCFNESKAILSVSESVTNKYKKMLDNEEIITIHDGIEIDKTFKKNFNDISDKIRFCIVGSLGDNKNQMEILKAVKVLLDKGKDQFVLNIIGIGSEEYKEKLELFIKENNIGKNVKLWGYRDDVIKLLECNDVGIISSRNEAFGRVTTEYMSKYMPVIGANTGGTKEIVENEVSGFLYQLGNIEDLADKMEYFIDNKSEIERMGRNAYNSAISKFDMSINTDKIYEVFKDMMVWRQQ